MAQIGTARQSVKTTLFKATMFAASKSGSVDAKDPQFNYVTMLLHGDGTNGAQNNTFLDSSTNNFTITRNGNTTQGTFTPYGSNWSNYFDGTGDYLELASNSAFNMNTYCCLEAFVSYSTIGTSTLIAGRDSSYWLGYNFTAIGGSANKFVFTINNGSSWQAVSSTTTPVVGVWYHVVGIKDNTTLRIYINGTQENTATFSGTAVTTSNVMGIGANQNTQNMAGYVSNTRLVLGASSGVLPYTSNFTSPTTPLTAVSGTALLTCQSNRFIDNSTNNFTITKNGDTSVQRFSPFSPTTAYSTSVIGGSAYFDGSGDTLSLASQTALNFGTGDFTLEAWVYATTTLGDATCIFTAVTTGGMMFGTNGGAGSGVWAIGRKNIAWDYSSSTVPAVNQWQHVAVCRSGTSVRIFINGVQSGTTGTNSTAYDLSLGGTVSGYQVNYMNGYFSSIRATNTALYTTTFTPPSAPLTAVSGTALLLLTTNAGILDNAMMNDLETVGNAQISTSVKKYGTGSIAFDGTGDALYATSQATTFGTGDFTLEFWIYFNAVNNGVVKYVYDMRNSGSTTASFLAQESSNAWTFWNGAGSVLSTGFTGSTFSATTWTHVAICRSSGTTKFFVNGTQTGSVADTSSYANSTLTVGTRYSYSDGLNGYIDDLRITKGVARYTANFTAPTTAFADKG
jgi:hypothetical protein